MPKLHHVAMWVREDEVDQSLRFYRDGLGLDLIMDVHVAGDFAELFDVPYRRLRSLMLGDRSDLLSGIFELVVFDQPSGASPSPTARPLAESEAPSRFLLNSFYVEFDEVLPRLTALGFMGSYQEQSLGTPAGLSRIGTLRDPHGFMVELCDRRVATLLLEQQLQYLLQGQMRPAPT